MNLFCPPQFLWLFQTCQESCPNFNDSQNLKDAIDSLYTETWSNPTSPSGQLLSNSNLYANVAFFVFGIQDSNKLDNANPVDILHKNGYFIRYPRNLFELEFSIQNYLSVTECLMWAYLDRHFPMNEMSPILGKSRYTAVQDSEASICRWISAIVAKHSRLPPLNVIGKQFFGLPYFRIILYHFTMNETLLNIADSKNNNARISFDFCLNYHISLPFNVNEVEQPPLCILCFLCNAIKILVKIKVVRKRPPVITDSIVVRKLNGIQQLRTEVNQLTIRCSKLSDEVNLYSKIVKSRPHSVIAKTRPLSVASVLNKPKVIAKPAPHAEPAPRVSWDPNVVRKAGCLRLKATRENEPNNV